MQKVIANNFKFRKNGKPAEELTDTHRFSYSEKYFTDELVLNLKTRFLALAIFAFFFIENGGLGLIPDKYVIVYRSVKISDFILYGLVFYSLFMYKEYKDLFSSKALLLPKIFLAYLLFEFLVSFIKYGFNPLEYFFRLKGVWTSFLIFPFLLLLKRKGLPFLIKIMLPIAIISNVLYILSAITGIPFLAGVSIVKQRISGDIEVFRVYGGTFYGELFYLGFVYFWITKKFRLWQMFLVVLFIIPHILAFGRTAWAYFIFIIVLMIVFNSLRKKKIRVLFRQALIMVLLAAGIIIGFIQFIPESDFYIDAVKARLSQGQEDVKYDEGTFGTKTLTQNSALVKLWSESDIILGIGMHPMWVVEPQSREETIYYSAFCDVGWPAVLAAYGLIGLILAVIIQIYFIIISYRMIRKIPDGTIWGFFTVAFFSKLVFDMVVTFSFVFVSTALWGFFFINYKIAIAVYIYEKVRQAKLTGEPIKI